MKTLYLHIGTTKTGTTSIQMFCHKNQTVLQAKNYCFPDSIHKYRHKKDATYKTKGIYRNGLFLVGAVWDENDKHDYAEEERLFNEGMTNVANLFETYDNIILSDESIWYLSSYGKCDIWDKLKAEADAHGYQIKIIVYLRPQDDFFISNWNQVIKENLKWNHMNSTIDAYMEKTLNQRSERYAYDKKLDLISDFFGKENIIVRRFDRHAFYGGNIYTDFLYCLGLELTDDFILLENEVNNTSLNGNSLEIMRLLNKIPDLSTRERQLYLEDLRNVNEMSEYACSMLSPEERQSFMANFEEGNHHVAETYLRDGKPLFDKPPVQLPKWDPVNPYMQEELLWFFTMTNHRLYEQIQEFQTQVNTLTKQNKQLEKKSIALEEKLQHTKNQLKHPAKTIGTKIISKVRKK